MNRRSLLASLGMGYVSLSGCLGDDTRGETIEGMSLESRLESIEDDAPETALEVSAELITAPSADAPMQSLLAIHNPTDEALTYATGGHPPIFNEITPHSGPTPLHLVGMYLPTRDGELHQDAVDTYLEMGDEYADRTGLTWVERPPSELPSDTTYEPKVTEDPVDGCYRSTRRGATAGPWVTHEIPPNSMLIRGDAIVRPPVEYDPNLDDEVCYPPGRYEWVDEIQVAFEPDHGDSVYDHEWRVSLTIEE